jgi:hypothetical protein
VNAPRGGDVANPFAKKKAQDDAQELKQKMRWHLRGILEEMKQGLILITQ